MSALNELANAGTGLVSIAMALFFVGFALRSDRRLNRRVEDQLKLLWSRVTQLEDVLTDAGMTLPPWPSPQNDRHHRGDIHAL